MVDYSKYSLSVGFWLKQEEWYLSMTQYEYRFLLGEVTNIGFMGNSAKQMSMGQPTRILYSDSGAAIAAGYRDVRYGFISASNPALTYISTSADPAAKHRIGTCYFGADGLVQPKDWDSQNGIFLGNKVGIEKERVAGDPRYVDIKMSDLPPSELAWTLSENYEWVPVSTDVTDEMGTEFPDESAISYDPVPNEDSIADVDFVPLNMGGLAFDSELDEEGARMGFFHFAALCDGETIAIARPEDPSFEFALNNMTDIRDWSRGELGDSDQPSIEQRNPVHRMRGKIITAVERKNEYSQNSFWELTVELGSGHQITCCAADPDLQDPSMENLEEIIEDAKAHDHSAVSVNVIAEEADDSPYPVGAVIESTVLLTGRFQSLLWNGTLAASRVQNCAAMDSDLLPEDMNLQGSLPSVKAFPIHERVADFDLVFSQSAICTDIAGCLGYPVRSNGELRYLFTHLPESVRWASVSRFDLLTDENPARVGDSTICVFDEISTTPEPIYFTVGISPITSSWGAGIICTGEDSSRRYFAAIDCGISSNLDEEAASWAELLDFNPHELDGLWDFADNYGDCVIECTVVRNPVFHRNPITNLPFISVTGEIDGEDSTILLPCPEWLRQLARQSGENSEEFKTALGRLHGKTMFGRFDNCCIGYIEGKEYALALDRFDEVIRQRTPENVSVRRRQRNLRNIKDCYTNPEISLNAETVHLLEMRPLNTVELLQSLETGPLGIFTRLENLFDYYGINLFQIEPDKWATERAARPTSECVWLSLNEAQLFGGLVALEARDEELAVFGGDVEECINMLHFSLTHAAEEDNLERIQERFDELRAPESPHEHDHHGDPSLYDYLTDGESFETHREMVATAIAERRCLSILYGDREDEPTARIVRPVKLVTFSRPYVLAWDELREDWRTFRLDRFKLCSYGDCNFDELEVPLPDDMSEKDLSKIRKVLGDDVDNAVIRVAWSIGIGR